MKDRSSHKFACKLAVDRKSLYRVARITQTAFHRYLEQFFDLGIDRVEKKGADLYLHEALHNDFDKLPLTSNFFPEERDRLSALTYLTCGNALGFVHVLLELMLPGEFEQCCKNPLRFPRSFLILCRYHLEARSC